VADVYLYADESGDLDLLGTPGSSAFFGFGTATFEGEHGERLWEGLRLRCELEARGVHLHRGFHAKNDSRATRNDVFALIAAQAPRLDATFLLKAATLPDVHSRGPVALYQMALLLHLTGVISKVSRPADTVYIIVGSLHTSRKRDAIRHAVEDAVCHLGKSRARTLIPCIWDAPSSWGIQVADYGLWAIQRDLEGRPSEWLEPCVRPSLASLSLPWGEGQARSGK